MTLTLITLYPRLFTIMGGPHRRLCTAHQSSMVTANSLTPYSARHQADKEAPYPPKLPYRHAMHSEALYSAVSTSHKVQQIQIWPAIGRKNNSAHKSAAPGTRCLHAARSIKSRFYTKARKHRLIRTTRKGSECRTAPLICFDMGTTGVTRRYHKHTSKQTPHAHRACRVDKDRPQHTSLPQGNANTLRMATGSVCWYVPPRVVTSTEASMPQNTRKPPQNLKAQPPQQPMPA